MAWKMLFSVRMKSPDRIGIEERGTIRCTPFEGRTSLAAGRCLLEQPVCGHADGENRMPSPELERAPPETVVAPYAEDPAASSRTSCRADPGRYRGAAGGGRARHVDSVEGVVLLGVAEDDGSD